MIINGAEIPYYKDLISPTFEALINLGGSGTNDEICNQVIQDLSLPDEVVDAPHLGSDSQTQLKYELAWARTYLKKYGAVINSKRSVWSITPKFSDARSIDPNKVVKHFGTATLQNRKKNKQGTADTIDIDDPEKRIPFSDDSEYPDEAKPWRSRLSEILHKMNPYGFERLSQRLLRECGFTQVEVTSQSGDGGIDGKGKLSINGIFSFNVAFQCKRYRGLVGPDKVRDFRGSLSNSIEKGVLITTGSFSSKAKEEATDPGKQQIDLIDGEEFINKLAEYGIGVQEVKTYEIDEEYFSKI